MSDRGSRVLGVLARTVSVVSLGVAALLAISIVLILAAPTLKPFPVGYAYDLGDWLAGPFDGLFYIRKLGAYVAVHWGIAAIVWLVLGQLIALALRRGARAARPRPAPGSEGA